MKKFDLQQLLNSAVKQAVKDKVITYPEMTQTKIAGVNTLRFFCFLWIFFGHNIPQPSSGDSALMKAYAYIGSYSNWGVQIFFVLSSFLLTYLGIKEKERTGNFSVKSFLKRRAFRIFPLYYLVLFISFCILPILSTLLHLDISLPQNKWLYLFFLSNYDNSDHVFALQFLWTLAISEQYYWTWALCLLLLKKNFEMVTGFFLFINAIVYLVLPLFDVIIPSDPLVYLMNFATGCGLAICYNRNPTIHWPVFTAYCLLFATGYFFFINNTYTAKIFFCGLVACFILLVNHICNRSFILQNPVYKLCEQLGKYSYGLYVYSGFVITAGMLLGNTLALKVPLAVSLALQLLLLALIAHISYHYFEVKFLKLSNRYRK